MAQGALVNTTQLSSSSHHISLSPLSSLLAGSGDSGCKIEEIFETIQFEKNIAKIIRREGKKTQ